MHTQPIAICLSLKDNCDANAWGVHLLELMEKQGLKPDSTLADGGQMARKGQKDAWPDVPCHDDTFHALKPFGDLLHYLENRAMNTFKVIEDCRHKINHPWGKWKKEEKRQELFQKLNNHRL